MSTAFVPQDISVDVLKEKYCHQGEADVLDIYERVSVSIASVEKNVKLRKQWAGKFKQNMIDGAIGAGRIMSAAGTSTQTTLINCFVQPVADSIIDVDENGHPGIYYALAEAAETLRRGGGVGYDFSKIRPIDAFVKRTNSFASGPCSYMDVFDKSCGTVESAGARRGAQMGILKVNHPDVEMFIGAKRTKDRWNNFNVSLFVSDEFMEAVKNDAGFQLVHKARPTNKLIEERGCFQRGDGMWVYKTVKATVLWELIMKSNYDYAEPGILFDDTINRTNNLRYIEHIDATNPCAEQPLPPYGCCDLGPIILSKLVSNPFTSEAKFDFVKFKEMVGIHVRFLDNVLDVTLWPHEKQRAEAMSKRRIGLGYTGLGNALAMLGVKYNSPEGLGTAALITKTMTETAYRASIELAIEKGKFPLFDAEKYLENGTFASTLPLDIKTLIQKHGIRNSHLVSIAPTGTVSLAFADNASNGLEPPFSFAYKRTRRMQHDGKKEYIVLDHGVRVFIEKLKENKSLEFIEAFEEALCTGNNIFVFNNDTYNVRDILPKSIVSAMELSVDDHLDMLKAIAPYIDTAMSKTINVPADYPYDDFKKIYSKAFEYGIKGVATYRPNSILGAVLSTIDTKKETPPEPVDDIDKQVDDFLNAVVISLPDEEYDARRKRVDYLGPEGKDNVYILVTLDKKTFFKDGVPFIVERPVEVFIESNPDNVPSEWVDSLSRDWSLLARSGINMFCKALDNSKKAKSGKGRFRYGWIMKSDGTKVPRYHASEIACIGFAIQEMLRKRGIVSDVNKPFTGTQLFDRKDSAQIVNLTLEDQPPEAVGQSAITYGKICSECGAAAVIKKDGCDFCTNCGAQGGCG